MYGVLASLGRLNVNRIFFLNECTKKAETKAEALFTIFLWNIEGFYIVQANRQIGLGRAVTVCLPLKSPTPT